MRMDAVAGRQYRRLTPVASRMQMPGRKARRGAGAAAHPEHIKMNSIALEGRSVVTAMCVGQLGSLLPHVVVPSILAAFLIPEWQLTGAQAGLLAGSGAAGYMLTVPVLATLTDRIDARKILIAGIGFAGAYMPGLKVLTDRLAPGDSSRAVTLYTSSFSFGVGLSFLVSQLVAEAWGWRAAFLLTALGPLIML